MIKSDAKKPSGDGLGKSSSSLVLVLVLGAKRFRIEDDTEKETPTSPT